MLTFSNTFNGIPAGCIDCAIAQSQSEEKEEEQDRSGFASQLNLITTRLIRSLRYEI